jgi:hypothetical protein
MNYQWNVVQMDRLTSDGFVVTVHYTEMLKESLEKEETVQ